VTGIYDDNLYALRNIFRSKSVIRNKECK
jgi:hypothetical protein